MTRGATSGKGKGKGSVSLSDKSSAHRTSNKLQQETQRLTPPSEVSGVSMKGTKADNTVLYL